MLKLKFNGKAAKILLKLVLPTIVILANAVTLLLIDLEITGLHLPLFIIMSLLLIFAPGYCLFCAISPDPWKKFRLTEIIVLSLLTGLLSLIFLYSTLIAIGNFYRHLAVFFYAAFSIFFLLLGFFRKPCARSDENKKLENPSPLRTNYKSTILIFASLFLISFSIRSFYTLKAYPLFVGWDTPRYIHDSIWFTEGIPQQYPGGLPFGQYPAIRIVGATVLTFFGFLHSIPLFMAVLDSLSVFGIYLFFRKVSGNSKASFIGVFLYVLSFFSLRFYEDLYSDLFVNLLLPIGMYFLLEALDKKSTSKLAWAIIALGLAINSHSTALFRIALILSCYVFACIALRSLRRDHVKYIVLTSLLVGLSLLPYQVYLTLSGSSWSILNGLFFETQTFAFPTPSHETLELLKWGIPTIPSFLLNEGIFLALGGIILMSRRFLSRPESVFWFILLTALTIVIAILPHLDYAVRASLRFFYYYGLFSYLFKGVFLSWLAGSISSLLRNSGIRIFIRRIKPNLRLRAVTAFSTLGLITLVSGIVAISIDIYSFYPLRVEISELQYPPGIRIAPILNTEQYEALLWVKKQSDENDLIVVNEVERWYANILLENRKVYDLYDDKWFLHSRELSEIINGNDIYGNIVALSEITDNIFLTLCYTFDNTIEDLSIHLADHPLFLDVFEAEEVKIFLLNVQDKLNLLEGSVSRAKVAVQHSNETFQMALEYISSKEWEANFSLKLQGSEEYLVSALPDFISFDSISPQPLETLVDGNNFIYVKGDNDVEYIMSFTAVLLCPEVAWKDDSFIKISDFPQEGTWWGWDQDQTYISDGDIVTHTALSKETHVMLTGYLNIPSNEYPMIAFRVKNSPSNGFSLSIRDTERNYYEILPKTVMNTSEWTTYVMSLPPEIIVEAVLVYIWPKAVGESVYWDFIMIAKFESN